MTLGTQLSQTGDGLVENAYCIVCQREHLKVVRILNRAALISIELPIDPSASVVF